MADIILSPNQRHAVVGKTGSGKTLFSIALAAALVPADHRQWEVWWLDSKLDPRDGAELKTWGFSNPKLSRSRKHVKLEPKNGPIDLQAQVMCERALRRKKVLIVGDEYKHIVRSTRRAGRGIEGVHLRGRGLDVGMIGQTQEPVEIPRQLISQATHIYLFDLSYPTDIKYAQSLFPGYHRPPDSHGFWHCHVDGEASWTYYPHVRAWYESINQAKRIAS